MAEDSKKQMKTTNDRELQAGQFWKMIEKEMNLGKEGFVADSFGNVFRKIKGYQIMASNKDNLAEAKMVADFFKMVEIEQGKEEGYDATPVGIEESGGGGDRGGSRQSLHQRRAPEKDGPRRKRGGEEGRAPHGLHLAGRP